MPKIVTLPDEYDQRFSYSCAVRNVPARHTPAPTRFLGRRIYLGVIVVLAMAMQQGPAPWRLGRLRKELGVSRQTLERWRVWWREAFVESAFWKAAKAAFSPPVDEASAPRSLLERFAGDTLGQLAGLLRFLAPAVDASRVHPRSTSMREISDEDGSPQRRVIFSTNAVAIDDSSR